MGFNHGHSAVSGGDHSIQGEDKTALKKNARDAKTEGNPDRGAVEAQGIRAVEKINQKHPRGGKTNDDRTVQRRAKYNPIKKKGAPRYGSPKKHGGGGKFTMGNDKDYQAQNIDDLPLDKGDPNYDSEDENAEVERPDTGMDTSNLRGAHVAIAEAEASRIGDIRNQATGILEYLHDDAEMQTVLNAFKEAHIKHHKQEIVVAVVQRLMSHPTDIDLLGKLLERLKAIGVVSQAQVESGLNKAYGMVSNYTLLDDLIKISKRDGVIPASYATPGGKVLLPDKHHKHRVNAAVNGPSGAEVARLLKIRDQTTTILSTLKDDAEMQDVLHAFEAADIADHKPEIIVATVHHLMQQPTDIDLVGKFIERLKGAGLVDRAEVEIGFDKAYETVVGDMGLMDKLVTISKRDGVVKESYTHPISTARRTAAEFLMNLRDDGEMQSVLEAFKNALELPGNALRAEQQEVVVAIVVRLMAKPTDIDLLGKFLERLTSINVVSRAKVEGGFNKAYHLGVVSDADLMAQLVKISKRDGVISGTYEYTAPAGMSTARHKNRDLNNKGHSWQNIKPPHGSHVEPFHKKQEKI